jgi:hypothetical protein
MNAANENLIAGPSLNKPTAKERLASFGIILSGVTALVLILLYMSITLLLVVWALGNTAPFEAPGRVASLYTTIGGLVSALVVAVLAVSPPGGSPAKSLLGNIKDVQVEWENPFLYDALPDNEKYIVRSEAQQRIYNQREKWVLGTVALYLGAWVLCGAMALVIGIIVRPDVVSVLGQTGTTWLGIAVAAVYAYFGITPKTPE